MLIVRLQNVLQFLSNAKTDIMAFVLGKWEHFFIWIWFSTPQRLIWCDLSEEIWKQKNMFYMYIVYVNEKICFLGSYNLFSFSRGGKSKQGKGKNGKKGSGKKEGYDLIVHIDLQEWKLSDDMVIGKQSETGTVGTFWYFWYFLLQD